MARDLDTLKEKLWDVFERAAGKTYEDSTASGSSTPFNPTIENRKMLAEVARAITGIEQEQRAQRNEQREEEERKSGPKMPGK